MPIDGSIRAVPKSPLLHFFLKLLCNIFWPFFNKSKNYTRHGGFWESPGAMFFGTFLRVPAFGEFTNCSGARERTLPILPRRCPVHTIVMPKSVFSHFLINSGSYNGFKVWHFRRRDNFGSKFIPGTVEFWALLKKIMFS